MLILFGRGVSWSASIGRYWDISSGDSQGEGNCLFWKSALVRVIATKGPRVSVENGWSIFAVIRMRSSWERFPFERTFQASVPPLPETGGISISIHAAYIIEHLANGKEVYDLIQSCQGNLSHRGMLVLLAPDSRSQGFEFWNTNYIHPYPTTMRDVTMILCENDFSNISTLPINGLLTVPAFQRWPYSSSKSQRCFLYDYRVFGLFRVGFP